jgi:hypothetical protein
MIFRDSISLKGIKANQRKNEITLPKACQAKEKKI